MRSESAWRANLGLFLLTVVSVFGTGALSFTDATTPANKDASFFQSLKSAIANLTPEAIVNGGKFAGTVLTILVAHELGHYIAARIHKVDASLPFFIPMPLLSPFGTMGAVIRMRGAIPTKRALLDIGAAGPLAGLVFALPLYAWGVAHSHVIPGGGEHTVDLGESMLVRLFDHAFAKATPEGMVLAYSPVAFGAWGGLFVTMINLLPVGQLDGGHVAYALFGPKQNRYAALVHRAMLVFFSVIVIGHVSRDLASGRGLHALYVGRHIANALFWLVWFQVLAVLGSISSHARSESEDADSTTGGVSVRVRLVATVGLVFLASLARERASWALVGGFFAGLGFLVAMDVKGGVLRKHDLLDHPPTSETPLDGLRKVIAVVTLITFGLLFMPEPFML